MPSKRLPMHEMGVLTLFPKILGFLRTFEKVLRRVKGRALADKSKFESSPFKLHLPHDSREALIPPKRLQKGKPGVLTFFWGFEASQGTLQSSLCGVQGQSPASPPRQIKI